MARHERNDVDYYPHTVKHGKKMFYIRNKYKNDGYTVWHMLLEKLGAANYHYLDLNDEVELMYLSSEFGVSIEMLNDIIEDLVKLNEFDSELWENKILYNQKFVDSISDAYKKRNNKCINKDDLLVILSNKGILKSNKITLKGCDNPQSKVKDSKEYNTKENIEVIFPFDSEIFKKYWDYWKQYKLKEHKFKYKSSISEQAAAKKLSELAGGDESTALKIIEQSIAQGWSGFFELKSGGAKSNDMSSYKEELLKRMEA